jgi:hypothetical protein
MSEEFEDISNWAAVVGQWDVSDDRRVYKSPEEPQFPHGICVSNVRFSGGTARATIRFPQAGNGVTAEGRLLFGYRSPAEPYLTVGLGGAHRAYSVFQFEPTFGWRGLALVGSEKNLLVDHPYKVSVRVRGQRVRLEVDSVQVLEHVLDAPPPPGQFGLFAWGTSNVEFTTTEVSEEPGTVFVVMQFSDRYQDLYRDVIARVVEEYKLRAYHAGEVFGPGVILEDIVRGIIDAKIVVAEVTEQNPNVFYELGYAHAKNKPTILLAERGKKPPFDISGYRHLFYDNSIAGKSRIETDLRKHLEAILRE